MTMETVQQYSNVAFISYKSEDVKWAKWLQHKLEHYKIPSIIRKRNYQAPKYLRPVFRDKTSLGGGNTSILREGLEAELLSSRFLIVICSPNATQSAWVNKEVQTFIDAGRLSYIIPFVVAGIPHASDPSQECFPEALAQLPADKELLGFSVEADGKNGAFIRMVSRMLEVKYETLMNRFEEARRRKRIAIGAAAAVVAVAGFFLYNYLKVSYEYYADYVVRQGMPEGILPLSHGQTEKRFESYRFAYQRGKLRNVTHINRFGNPMSEDNTEHMDRAPIMDIQYEDGQLSSVIMRDVYGVETSTHQYHQDYTKVDLYNATTGDALTLSGSTTSIDLSQASELFDFNTFWLNTNVSIGRYVYEYDDDGYITSVMYKRDNRNTAARDQQGICGQQYERDELHRVTRLDYLDENGNVTADKWGVTSRHYTYDPCGGIAEVRYCNSQGLLTMNEMGFAMGKTAYDAEGNPIEERYYDPDEQLFPMKFGYAISRMEHGKDRTSVSYYDAEDKPCMAFYPNGRRMHKIMVEFDDRGFACRNSIYDIYGYYTYDMMGCSVQHIECDDHGRMVRAWLSDSTDTRINNMMLGYCEMELQYDESGNMLACTTYDFKGRRVNGPAGYSRVEQEFKDGKLQSQKYYDLFSQRVISPQVGAAGFSLNYDERGNIKGVTFLGLDDKPMSSTTFGFAISSLQYDDKGLCRRMESYNERNELVNCANGFAYSEIEHEDAGLISCFKTYDKDGNLLRGEKRDYDSQGLTTCIWNCDELGQPINNDMGFCYYTIENENGRVKSTATYNADFKPVVSDTMGCHKLVYEYDRRGYATAQVALDTDKQPMVHKRLFAQRVEMEYNALGLMQRVTYYNAQHKKVCCADGFSEEYVKYNLRGQETEHRYMDEDGRLTKNRNAMFGYAMRVFEYNDVGYPVEEAYYDENMQPTNNQIGVHKVVYGFNPVMGCQYLGLHMDKDGKLVDNVTLNPQIAAIHLMHDPGGAVTYIVSLDADLHAVLEQRYDYVEQHNALTVKSVFNRMNESRESLSMFDPLRGMVTDFNADSITHVLDSLKQISVREIRASQAKAMPKRAR